MNSKLNIKQFIISISVLTVFATLSIWAIYFILFSNGFNSNLPIWVAYFLVSLLTIFPMLLVIELMSLNQISIDKENITIRRFLRPAMVVRISDIKKQVLQPITTFRKQESYIYSTLDNKTFFISRGLFKNFISLRTELNKDKEVIPTRLAPVSIYYLIIWATLIVTLGTVISRLGSS